MTQEARYTSPSGKEIVFAWETAKRDTELKTGVFTFPGKDGANVQHQGAGAKTFPLVCIFSGADYAARADEFEAMLIERGVAELQHPLYGTIKVKPVGHIEREDDPVKKLGESAVTITFTETLTNEAAAELSEAAAEIININFESFTEAAVTDFANELAYPIVDQDAAKWIGKTSVVVLEPGGTLPEGAKLKNEKTGETYSTTKPVMLDQGGEAPIVCDKPGSAGNINKGDKLKFVDPPETIEPVSEVREVVKLGHDKNTISGKSIDEQLPILSNLDAQTQSIIDNLQSIASSDKKGFAQWLASAKELKDNIKNLYSKAKRAAGKIEGIYAKALNAGRLTLRLMKLPSDIAVSLAEKIKGFSALTASLINQYKNDPFGIKKIKAAYATATLALTGAVAAIASGSALTVAETAATREEAVETANRVAGFFETVTAFQDTKIAQNAFVDASPSAYLALNELVYNSIQLILNASFALPMQKTITLDRDRQVIELCAELYGTTDYLDEFIMQNKFNIDEIELLPMGKKVSYYVKNA